jgi:hypothetical protein
MGLSDKQLDELIRLTVKTQSVVTPRQKEAAREQLLRKAAQQAMLVPYAAPPVPLEPASDWFDRITSGILRGLYTVFIEEHRYHRAAHNRHFMPITSIIGVTMVIHFYPPVRYQLH